jgi:putative oxidoreductase
LSGGCPARSFRGGLLLEIFGGLALLRLAFVAIVSIPLIFSMLGAMFTVNIKYGFSAVNTIG